MKDNQKDSRLGEVIRFALTGGVCTLIEWGLFALLGRVLPPGTDSLIPTAIAFLLSTVVNYLICFHWVFRGARDGGLPAKAGFLVTSLMGLGLNALLMLLFRALWGEDSLLLTFQGFRVETVHLNKALATLLVMVWNYFTKRAILSSSLMQRLTERLRGKE